jgi:hypothetical protein
MTQTEAISLGWRCESAQIGVNLGLRGVRSEGYRTGPFDLHNSNYLGVVECIKDDFKYFTDPNHLKLVEGTFCSEHFAMHAQPKTEFQIVNTYYGFVFNHESPGHGDLYLNERWPNGINHFVDNNFELFIERYNKRIENFRYYLSNYDKINFILMRYNSVPVELCEAIEAAYPDLNFNIYSFIDYSPYTYGMTHEHTDDSVHAWEMKQWEIMGITRESHPEEFERYERPLLEGLENPRMDKIKILRF